MENYTIVLFILALMIGLSAMADKIKLPYPVLLITAGIAIGFVPALPHIELDPEVIFLIFLPPLLYDAAFNISIKELKSSANAVRTNINTIGTLATSLVFLSAAGIAVAARYMIPGMNWPAAFVLGAILSATDAVAAMSITKGFKLSHKTTTILEGESLLNDASALVAYRFALAAVTGVSFVLWKAVLQFFILIGGGVVIGLLAGRLLAQLLKIVQHNQMAVISFMLLAPFVTYLLAEQVHVSGVIAVVVLGLGIAQFSNKVFSAPLKQQSQSIWDISIFLLNGLIFILIGLQFPYVIRTLEQGQLLPHIGYALVIAVVALALRAARVFMQQVNLQKAFKYKKRKITEQALLDAKTRLIISWSGMRGIVSLAMAIALPATLQDGQPFEQRNAIIFITVAVVLFTIVGQGLSLPWLIRKLKPEEE